MWSCSDTYMYCMWYEGCVAVYYTAVPVTTCPQVQALAQELQSLHFSESQESTRKVASELRAILVSLEAACLAHENGTVSHREPSLSGRIS